MSERFWFWFCVDTVAFFAYAIIFPSPPRSGYDGPSRYDEPECWSGPFGLECS